MVSVVGDEKLALRERSGASQEPSRELPGTILTLHLARGCGVRPKEKRSRAARLVCHTDFSLSVATSRAPVRMEPAAENSSLCEWVRRRFGEQAVPLPKLTVQNEEGFPPPLFSRTSLLR